MKLEIVIPSLNRIQKLSNCVDSIISTKNNFDIALYLYFSNRDELDFFKEKYKDLDWIYCKMTDYYKCTEFWNKHIKNSKANIIAYLNDDILLHKDTIQKIFTIYPQQFPDFDGVIGINQANIPQDKIVKTAFGLIGTKYSDLFPDRQVFCPDYYRFFGDYEMYLYSNSIGKFYFSDDIKIKHLHPQFSNDKNGRDETHRLVRKWRGKDSYLFQKRQNLKWLWGKDYSLLGE